MSLYSWQVFVAVADCKSFSKAAQILNLTPSAVSHMVAKLEKEYGSPLFIRNRNSIEPTTSGTILLPYVKNLLKCNDALEQEVNSLKHADSGLVRIASFNSVTKIWLPQILHRFQEKYPDIQVSVRQSGDIRVKKWIERGEVDLAICTSGLAGDKSFLPLHRTPLVCVTPKDFVPMNGESVTAEDLKDKPIILQLEGYDTEPITFLMENNIFHASNYRIEVDDTCYTYVEQGFGFHITPDMTLRSCPANVNVYPLVPTTYRTVGLVTVYPEYISHAAQLFRQEIFQFVSESGLMNI